MGLSRKSAADEQELTTHPMRQRASEILRGVCDILGPAEPTFEGTHSVLGTDRGILGKIGEDPGTLDLRGNDGVDRDATVPDLLGKHPDGVAVGHLAGAVQPDACHGQVVLEPM
ncbi:hypothetical protein GCM10027089_39960 [Nocardia thraciensis]